jgi:WhiB family transcriptional regulator, redox-sensing transcriptional regulator
MQPEKQPEWYPEARCKGVDPEIFFPATVEDAEPAKSICGVCPVKSACLDYALSTFQRDGVWGGATEYERRVIKRNLRREVASRKIYPTNPESDY